MQMMQHSLAENAEVQDQRPLLAPPQILSPSLRPYRHAPLLSQGSSDCMHIVNGPQEAMLPYMDITTEALLAMGDQVVAVV